MKRHPSLIPLSRFHRSMLFLALIGKENAPPVKGYPQDLAGKLAYAQQFYETRIQAHWQQEAALYAAARGYSAQLDTLLDAIIAERKQLHQLFASLREQDSSDVLHELACRIEQHVRREERELFQCMQTALPDEMLEQLAAVIKPESD